MKLLIFSRQEHPVMEKVTAVVQSVENIRWSWLRDQASLEDAMAGAYAGETLMLFFIEAESDMVFLEQIQKGFMDIKLVVYFACEKNGMMARAYKCFPRLITGDFDRADLLVAAIKGIAETLRQSAAAMAGGKPNPSDNGKRRGQ